jgi:hypothetical protein
MIATMFAVLALAAPVIVEGHGTDAAAAGERAMEAAQRRLVAMLPEALARAAPLDPDLLRQTGAVTPEGGPAPSVVVQGSRLVVARYRVELTPAYLAEARRVARDEMSRERQALLGKILAGILVALLVVCGYVRLEEWTRGYATRLLQMASLAVLAVAGLVLWLLP